MKQAFFLMILSLFGLATVAQPELKFKARKYSIGIKNLDGTWSTTEYEYGKDAEIVFKADRREVSVSKPAKLFIVYKVDHLNNEDPNTKSIELYCITPEGEQCVVAILEGKKEPTVVVSIAYTENKAEVYVGELEK